MPNFAINVIEVALSAQTLLEFVHLYSVCIDIQTVRAYLLLPPRLSAAEVMRDAVLVSDPGAVYILTTVLEVRVNRRSRRSLADVVTEFPKSRQARWYGVVENHVWSLYRLFFAWLFIMIWCM